MMDVAEDFGVYAGAIRVRDLVNGARTLAGLWRESDRWAVVCSAMDVIEDSAIAITEYLSRPVNSRIGYIELYGAFQALYLQQDATKNLAEALGSSVFSIDDPTLARVRQVRNDVCGHPTKRRESSATLATHVAQASITREGFLLLRYARGGGSVATENIDTPGLIAAQAEVIARALVSLATELEAAEMEHRRMHREEKLSNLIPQGWDYLLQKVGEAGRTRDEGRIVPGQIAHEIFVEASRNLREATERRGLESDGLSYCLDAIDEALASMAERLLPGSARFEDTERGVLVSALGTLLAGQVKDLEDITRELDDEYGSDAV
jgi:hypothetical protein